MSQHFGRIALAAAHSNGSINLLGAVDLAPRNVWNYQRLRQLLGDPASPTPNRQTGGIIPTCSPARLLHKTWQAELVLEHFDENPFLPLFYIDRQRYAWPTQLHFLIDCFDQWTELRPTPSLCVSDYLFDKDRVFAELNLDDVALRRYLKVFHALRSQLRHPTGVIYLHANVDVLLARLAARARAYEQQIERTYIRALADAYERFFATYDDAPGIGYD